MLKYSVGLDISSKSINGCLSTIDNGQKVKVKSTQTFANSKSGFKSMDTWIRKNHEDKNIPTPSWGGYLPNLVDLDLFHALTDFCLSTGKSEAL